MNNVTDFNPESASLTARLHSAINDRSNMRHLLVCLVGVLICVGVQMVQSASLTSRPSEQDSVLLGRHLAYLALSLSLCLGCVQHLCRMAAASVMASVCGTAVSADHPAGAWHRQSHQWSATLAAICGAFPAAFGTRKNRDAHPGGIDAGQIAEHIRIWIEDRSRNSACQF